MHRAKSTASTARKKECGRVACAEAEQERLRLTVAQGNTTALRSAAQDLSVLCLDEDVEEDELRKAELKVVRLEALQEGQRTNSHELRRQVGQDSRTPSPLSSEMSQRARSRSSRRDRDGLPQYYDAKSQASADSDNRYSMKRKKDA